MWGGFVTLFEEEVGLPGHPSKKEWAKKLQRFLKENGFSFDAEGEATLVNLGEVTIEVGESNGKYAVTVSVPLPGAGEDDDPDHYSEAFRKAITVMLGIGGSLEYQLDTSLPDYPTLYITRKFDDPEELVDKFISALRKIGPRTSRSIREET